MIIKKILWPTEVSENAAKTLPLVTVLAWTILTGVLAGCTGVPKGLNPVADFNLNRYSGPWYEIARLDHSFERGLTRVSAQYSLSQNGEIFVVNRGFDHQKNEWKVIEGRAVFTGGENVGSLKVSFFGPFYGGYHIIDLDQQAYRYAMVAGATRSYLWILARSPRLEPAILQRLIAKAQHLGFETEKLIMVDQAPAVE